MSAPSHHADVSESTAAAPPEEQQLDPTAQNSGRGEFAMTLLCDLVLPIGLFYVFRAAGMGQLVALLLSATPPALHTLYIMVRHRRVETIGVFVLGIVVLSSAVSVISGDPRAVLVRGAVLTGLIALWMLSTVFLARPFVYRALEALLPGKRQLLDQLWRRDPDFRAVWQRITVLWGLGLLADAVIRVIMAYTLPVDSVPAIEGVLYIVTWIGLQIVTQVWLSRTGTLRKIFGANFRLFGRRSKETGETGETKQAGETEEGGTVSVGT